MGILVIRKNFTKPILIDFSKVKKNDEHYNALLGKLTIGLFNYEEEKENYNENNNMEIETDINKENNKVEIETNINKDNTENKDEGSNNNENENKNNSFPIVIAYFFLIPKILIIF